MASLFQRLNGINNGESTNKETPKQVITESESFGKLLKVNRGENLNESEGDNQDNQDNQDNKALEESVVICQCEECGHLYESEGVCDCGGQLFEAVKVVVRDGKVEKKKIKNKKTKLSAAQKTALAKARKKAHSAGANKARAKSMKVRKKKVKEAEDMLCPVCDFVGQMSEIEDGVFVCPDCGAELEVDNEACKGRNVAEDKNEANKGDLEALFAKVKKGFASRKGVTVKLWDDGEIVVNDRDSEGSVNITVSDGVIFFEVFDLDSNDVLFEKIKLGDDKELNKAIKSAIAEFKDQAASLDESEKEPKEIHEGLKVYLEALEVPNNILNEGTDSIVAYLRKEYCVEVDLGE